MYYIALYWIQEGRVEDALSAGSDAEGGKFARRERIFHTEIDPLYVIPAAGGKSLKRKSLKNNEINC